MYYTKKLINNGDKALPEYDARGILRILNYFPFLNFRNTDQIRKTMEEPEGVCTLCDMSAAAITQLHYRNMIDLNLLWETVSTFFHQAIQMRGFDAIPSPEDEFNREQEDDIRIVILVAGTQSQEVFKARVDGAIAVLRETVPPECRIIFSGANPAESMKKMGAQGAVTTIHEAADMELYFRKCIEKSPLPNSIDVSWHRESDSATTAQNIENFFNKAKLKNDNRNHVYVVSSLFHLPRFIDNIMKKIKSKKIPVFQITFVSSEDPMDLPTAAVGTPGYLKSCMYEFFHLLYKHTPKEEIFKWGYPI